jgi:hypothetical protein
MELDIPTDRVLIVLDYEDTVRGLVQGRGDNSKNIEALTNCLVEEYGASYGNIQKIEYYSYSDSFAMTIHLWINEEGGSPDVYEFLMQKSKLY